MTSVQYYHSLIEKDDDLIWGEINDHLFGNDFDDDLDNRIFNNWEH